VKMTSITKNLLKYFETQFIEPSTQLVEGVTDENYQEVLKEIEHNLKEALKYVQTMRS